MSLLTQTTHVWFSNAVAAVHAGDRARARELLGHVVQVNEDHLQAWLWLAGLAEDRAEQRRCLEKVFALSLGPDGLPVAAEPPAVGPPSASGPQPSPAGAGADPGSNPGANPGSNPGANPGSNPGANPSANPGSNPGANPGSNPGANPGSNPGSNPGAAPSPPPRRARWPLLSSPAWLRSHGAVALGFLAWITLAELLVASADARLGLAFHCLLLASLFFAATRSGDRPQRALLVSLAFAPLIRILSLSLPLTRFPILYWYLFTSLPLFAALFVAAPALGYTWRDLGLHLRGLPLQAAVAVSGLLFGAVEFYILRPEPLVPALAWDQIWWPALVLLVSTGLLEEMIFRGLQQRAAAEALGRWGMAYVALLFAVLHLGYQSLVDVLFVFGVGLFLGWAVQRTRSLLGVTLAHGLTNVMLYLVMPFLVGG